ncbi:MAG: Calx-beta domain-containing protein, partial [Lysobacterales bacterium]
MSLSATSGQAVSVDFTTTDGTAVAPNDYTATSGTLTIVAGSGSGPIAVIIIDDAVSESTETFTVDLSNAVNATLSDNQGVGTITDDDGGGQPVTVSFQDGVNGYSGTVDTKLKVNSSSTNYGSDIALEVDGSPDESTLLSWDVTSIPPGSIIELADITVNVTNKSGDDYEFYQMLRPWVEDEATWDDYASGQSWQVPGADGTADRGATVLGSILASSTGTKTVSLNAAGIAVVQSWVNSPSSNHGFIVLDYISASNGINFSSRETGTVSERPKLTVTYSTGSQSSLAIDDVTVTEGNSGTVNASFMVTLSSASSQMVTVDYGTADGTATAGSDYVSVSGQVSFQPGETSQPVTVVVNGDVLDEADETFFVNLSNAVNATISDNQGEGTITDDDPPPSLSIDDVTTDEGAGTMTFTVSLSAVSGQDVSVDFTTTDGAAVAPDDYTATSGTLTIPAGSD